jgi:uncharacterized protein
MQVSIEEIREGGLTRTEPVSQALLEQVLSGDRDTGFRAATPATLTATFQKVSGGVLLHGELTAELQSACKRCLADVTVKLPVEFTLNLVPEKTLKAQAGGGEGDDDEAGEQAGSFEMTDADREPFNGKTIDLDPIVREQVLLALPMHAVCKEDCKGMCGVCGQNLNEKACGCQTKVVDPRLAALKDIKL